MNVLVFEHEQDGYIGCFFRQGKRKMEQVVEKSGEGDGAIHVDDMTMVLVYSSVANELR